MLGKRATLVAGRAQQQAAPEIVHSRQVPGPVDLGKVVENRVEQRVLVDLVVERIDQSPDVGFAGNIDAESTHIAFKIKAGPGHQFAGYR